MEMDRAVGQPKRGRSFSEDSKSESFLRFAGAVIFNMNESGDWNYASILRQEKAPGERFRYRTIPASLFETLAGSGFPPAMIAVATAKIIPLNFKTRSGAKPIKPAHDEKAVADLRRSAQPVSAESFELARRKAKLERILQDEGVSPSDVRTALTEAWKSGFKADWVRLYFAGHETPAEKRASGKTDSAISCKGTPAHRIRYSGVKLSRRMASYWKHHPRFRDCVRFVHGLFSRDIPSAPFDGPPTWIDHAGNAEIYRHARRWINQARIEPAPLKSKQTTRTPPKAKPDITKKTEPETTYKCEECGEDFDESRLAGPLYECGDCGVRFTQDTSADGNGHRCPECNKFGAKVADLGCPECGEGELVAKSK
ncbi:MAG TPA: hypothetical protein VNZ64_12330 [Candidatus Acidoferrum sp.]|nr:hypothetical protein [Candidatus Acidoferrum sp.]